MLQRKHREKIERLTEELREVRIEAERQQSAAPQKQQPRPAPQPAQQPKREAGFQRPMIRGL